MSPRKPAVLRGGGENLRAHLIATAARLLDERGSAGLSVRDIAREAQVADGALYNYFEDKEDLLAHALLAHVGAVMSAAPPMRAPGTGTVTGNLGYFIDRGLELLGRLSPAFAGLQSQPGVLARFHAMVGGDAAFGVGDSRPADGSGDTGTGDGRGDGHGARGGHSAVGGREAAHGRAAGPDAGGPASLPETLLAYLRAEQELGRVAAGADVDAATALIVGAIHGQILPQVLLRPPGTPITAAPGLAARLARTVMDGLAPRP
jgi:AcrR family transcriptional regulator